MTADTLTLTDFLLARIADDEAAIEGPWSAGDDGLHIISTPMGERMLRECAAKRAVVDDFKEDARDYRESPSDFAAGRRHAALLAVTRAAAIYADHPDYRAEWRA